MTNVEEYREFLAGKCEIAKSVGFCIEDSYLDIYRNDELGISIKDFQRHLVKWALGIARAALFTGTGTGKTLMEGAWSDQIRRRGNHVMGFAPLAVADQMIEEFAKFGIPARHVKDQSEAEEYADEAGGFVICISNYDRIKLFDADWFGAVFLDESSIIKDHNGATRNLLIDKFSRTKFKLCATATPSPNDHTELGNHLEFLGYKSMVEMLATWFVHDGGDTSKWRLKGHAKKSFWRSMASVCACMRKPSDIGFSDDGYDLPPLEIIPVTVESDLTVETGNEDDGQVRMFRNPGKSATGIHTEKRRNCDSRAERSREIFEGFADRPNEPWVIWCETDYEQDALEKVFGDLAISIRGSRGSQKDTVKVALYRRWRDGERPVLITKGSLFGWGMNWQHCCYTVIMSMGFSWERYFQMIMRFWRFGQLRPVKCWVITAEAEDHIKSTIERKERDNAEMSRQLIEAMAEVQIDGTFVGKDDYHGGKLILPKWWSIMDECT